MSKGPAYDVLMISEASKQWDIPISTLRAALSGDKFAKQRERGLIRKSDDSSVWIITVDAMVEVYQDPSYVSLKHYERVTRYLNEQVKLWYDVFKKRYEVFEWQLPEWHLEGLGTFRVNILDDYRTQRVEGVTMMEFQKEGPYRDESELRWVAFEGKPNLEWRPFGDFSRNPIKNADPQTYQKVWERRFELDDKMWEKVGIE